MRTVDRRTRTREVIEPEHTASTGSVVAIRRVAAARAAETVPELLVGEREAVRPRWLVDVDAQVRAEVSATRASAGNRR